MYISTSIKQEFDQLSEVYALLYNDMFEFELF